MKKQSKSTADLSLVQEKIKPNAQNGRLVATISPEVEEFITNIFPKTLRSTVINQISIAFMKYCEKNFGGVIKPLNQSDTLVLLSNFLHYTSSLQTYSQYRK